MFRQRLLSVIICLSALPAYAQTEYRPPGHSAALPPGTPAPTEQKPPSERGCNALLAAERQRVDAEVTELFQSQDQMTGMAKKNTDLEQQVAALTKTRDEMTKTVTELTAELALAKKAAETPK